MVAGARGRGLVFIPIFAKNDAGTYVAIVTFA
jgi:hypothetical protein